jgi:hypothetical protein
VLNLDPQEFAGHWNAHLPTMYSNPRPLREYIADYVLGLGRTLSEAEFAAFDDVWSAHDAALGSPRPQVLSALSRIAAAGVRLGQAKPTTRQQARRGHGAGDRDVVKRASAPSHVGCQRSESSGPVVAGCECDARVVRACKGVY